MVIKERERRVEVFFYGLFMDEELLREVLAIFASVKNLGHQEGLPENN